MENRHNRRQGNMNDQVSVSVTALALSLIEKCKQLHPVSRERCIYRVPKRLTELNEKAYTPRCVSIGPYHHGKYELRAMEEYKILYLQHFLRFSQVCLIEFVSCVKNNETKLRNCYQERIDLCSASFVRLMLFDVAFVIMVMLKNYSVAFHIEDELLFNKPWMMTDIRNDMILLENQLPFFILDHFLVLSNLKDGPFSMVQISSHFFKTNFLSWVPSELNFSECKHLVDFLRIGQQPLEQNKLKHAALDVVNLRSAVELHQAGIKFKRISSLRLTDINFHDGTLEIPLLTIYHNSEILFRNLQAFEQSHYSVTYFLDYITMINFLVRNGRDVEFLTKEGIIENWLHDNEQIVHLLHNLAKENLLNAKQFYFADVVNNLNKYCSKRRNRWRANLIQNYFHNPWVTISIIAATFVILLTIVQTICSILQVKQQ